MGIWVASVLTVVTYADINMGECLYKTALIMFGMY
jgi:hypothetical protein